MGIIFNILTKVPKFGQGGRRGEDENGERRSESPTLCTFYNADFIIYSSMGSFYVPCVTMLLLYWKIFRVINDRIRRNRRLHDPPPPPPSSSGAGVAVTAAQQQQQPTWQRRITTGRRTFVKAVFDRLPIICFHFSSGT